MKTILALVILSIAGLYIQNLDANNRTVRSFTDWCRTSGGYGILCFCSACYAVVLIVVLVLWPFGGV